MLLWVFSHKEVGQELSLSFTKGTNQASYPSSSVHFFRNLDTIFFTFANLSNFFNIGVRDIVMRRSLCMFTDIHKYIYMQCLLSQALFTWKAGKKVTEFPGFLINS